MEQIEIKVCGMRESSNILAVSATGVSYMGFIFYPASPRYVGDEFIMPQLPSSINKVGVFVNESDETIGSLATKYGINMVQLHGDETPGFCLNLRNRGLKVIKVFSVDDHFDFGRTRDYKKVVDYFLFDTKGKLHGGNAKAFDWTLLTKYDGDVPFFLSGGLTPANLSGISSISVRNLYGVDVNSGVEDAPGMKNLSKINQVIAEVVKLQSSKNEQITNQKS